MDLKELFKSYGNGKEWKNVDKSHENLFILGAQAILLRNGNLLDQYINSLSDNEWSLLNEEQQKQLVKGFGEWCCPGEVNFDDEFNKIAKLMIKYLCENHNPHVSVIIDSVHAELLEGIKVVKTEEFVVD